jgi:hypothetical protein
VIGDLLAGQRVMTQRVFERVRRVELALGVPPSHYEKGAARPTPSEEETRVHGTAAAQASTEVAATDEAPTEVDR